MTEAEARDVISGWQQAQQTVLSVQSRKKKRRVLYISSPKKSRKMLIDLDLFITSPGTWNTG